MAEKGLFLGYDTNGNPVACALYGVHGETRASARRFCSSPGLTPRDFPEGDPDEAAEFERFRSNAV